MPKTGIQPETKAKIEHFKKLMADGMQKVDAAAKAGINRVTINRYAAECDIPVRKYRRRNSVGPTTHRPMMTSVEVPVQSVVGGKVLLIYGSAAECAEIARKLV